MNRKKVVAIAALAVFTGIFAVFCAGKKATQWGISALPPSAVNKRADPPLLARTTSWTQVFLAPQRIP